MRGRHYGYIREYKPVDLPWIERMAKKYGHSEFVQDLLINPEKYSLVCAVVIPPYAVGAVYFDQCGAVLSGLCDDYGIRQLITIGRVLTESFKGGEIELHNHAERGTWQYKLLNRWGFEPKWPKNILTLVPIVKTIDEEWRH